MSLAYVLPKTQRGILERSFEFHGDTEFNNTNAAAGNTTDAVISLWFRAAVRAAATRFLFESKLDANNYVRIFLTSSHTLDCVFQESSIERGRRLTTDTYDDADWHHVHLLFDLSNGVAASRMVLLVDGVAPTLSGSSVDPGSSLTLGGLGEDTSDNYIGSSAVPGDYWTGIIGDPNVVDGLTPAVTAFGKTDPTYGWVWRDYTGSHGVNGIRLEWLDEGDLGKNTAVP